MTNRGGSQSVSNGNFSNRLKPFAETRSYGSLGMVSNGRALRDGTLAFHRLAAIGPGHLGLSSGLPLFVRF